MKVSIILAHPDLENASLANKIIIKQVKSIKEVEVRDLYKMYPDFKIDVEAEQKALEESEFIVFQFPFYWYGMPGMLKEWLDKVFVYGFAFGPDGSKLEGKDFLISTTVGGSPDTYQEGGNNHFTVEEFLRPLEQTARLTGMIFDNPLVTYDMLYMPDIYDNKKEDVEYEARAHARRLFNFITGRIASTIF
ncbi:MAG: NAD(P)H-dependent oxidoreductase [Bacteriovoracaceae bacterium]|nr:NAD(P)H-dependent oxidoreductase [Bacteriovoracaceae bacterium]